VSADRAGALVEVSGMAWRGATGSRPTMLVTIAFVALSACADDGSTTYALEYSPTVEIRLGPGNSPMAAPKDAA
jgi:hypothetical protein